MMKVPVILLTSLSRFHFSINDSRCNPRKVITQTQISTPNSPLQTGSLRRRAAEHSWPQSYVSYKFTSSPNPNPNIIAHLPASEFPHQSPDRCLRSYPHAGLKHINTSSTLHTQALHAHVLTIIQPTHTLTHEHPTYACVCMHAVVHTRTHSSSVPYLIANPTSLGSSTLKLQPSDLLLALYIWHLLLSPLELEHGLSLMILTCLTFHEFCNQI